VCKKEPPGCGYNTSNFDWSTDEVCPGVLLKEIGQCEYQQGRKCTSGGTCEYQSGQPPRIICTREDAAVAMSEQITEDLRK
jgi:hypothetical protein